MLKQLSKTLLVATALLATGAVHAKGVIHIKAPAQDQERLSRGIII